MDWQNIGAFALATIVLCVVPGPVMAIVTGNTLKSGQAAGFQTVLGIGLGEAMMLGMTLVSILASEALVPSLFPWVSLGGAAYLVWLAFRTLQPRKLMLEDADDVTSDRPFVDGLVIALCNPAALLFYTTFFMQFIDRAGSIALQASVLATTYFLTSIAFDLGCVLFAVRARPSRVPGAWFRRAARLACGVVYFGTSIAAFSGFLTSQL